MKKKKSVSRKLVVETIKAKSKLGSYKIRGKRVAVRYRGEGGLEIPENCSYAQARKAMHEYLKYSRGLMGYYKNY